MTELQRRIIEALQDGLSLVEEPFQEIADRVGAPVDEVLEQINAWKADGTIRRFGAILRHRRAGYTVNAMGVWNVPDERAEAFGRVAARFRLISHCYRRPGFEGFDYNLYTMIHGRSREECEETAKAVSKETGITGYALLYTTAEFKKSSPVYPSGSNAGD